MATLPDDEASVGLSLHVRMIAEDPVVFDEIYTRYCPSLEAHLRAYISRRQLFLPGEDLNDLIQDAIADALLGYHKNPGSYKPKLRSLRGYLQMSALGDFKNHFSSAMKSQSKIVQIEEEDWNIIADGRFDPVAATEAEEAINALHVYAESAVESDDDRIVMDLLLQSERKTEIFAEALGISHLPPQDQRSAVNKIKDRLSKRLKRGYRGGSADGTNGPGTR
jgi:DNA-directed RNA polymerase specialized sigma24 family protein